MRYKIEINKPSYKFLLKQDRTQQARILNAINKLPDRGDIKPLQGHDGVYRLRVGDYRVLFTIDNDILTVGNTAQRAATAFAAHLLAYFPSSCTEIF